MSFDLEYFVSSCHQVLMDLKSESEQQVVWTLGQNSDSEFCSVLDSPPFSFESSGRKKGMDGHSLSRVDASYRLSDGWGAENAE